VEQASLDEIRQGSSLEDKFLEVVGGGNQDAQKLSWLES
jgi:ABC-2 type transport system ATP-binding protein